MLLGTAASIARGYRALSQLQGQAWGFFAALVLHALRDDELEDLSSRLYHASPYHRGDRIEAWEDRWWSASLPRPPARVLVGGCGAGREILWLVERGYSVEAFDPAASLVRVAKQRLQGRARIEVDDYRHFIGTCQGRGPYDAILLGWGSFSHVLSASTREALLQVCSALCPHGPILLSWLAAAGPARHGRAGRSGARVGRMLGAVRGTPARQGGVDVLLPHAGPAHLFEEDEIREFARRVGRRPELEDAQEYPHATLWPSPAPRRRDVDVELVADVLRRGGRATITARGGSMSDAIPNGTRLAIEPLPGNQSPALGDVVAARLAGGLLVVHRVVGIDGRGRALLKGDTCRSPDGWVDPPDIVGRVAYLDGGRGPRAVPGPTAPRPRWRRAVGRFERAAAALRQG